MNSNINLNLSEELMQHVSERTNNQSTYSNPNDYICDLIRFDMLERDINSKIEQGLDDITKNRFSSKSILDIKNEAFNSK